MPIKVRCTNCEKVLNAPDAVRGKSVRCPGCRSAVRVPSGQRKTVATGPRTNRPAAGEASLENLDLSRAEDTSVRVCQKCGTEVEVDAIECPKCGLDLATGQLSERVRKIRERQGPDPAEFYAMAWKESWQFLKNNMDVVWRTFRIWAVTLSLTGFCGFVAFGICERFEPRVFWGGLMVVSFFSATGWYWTLSIAVIRATREKKKRIKRIPTDFFQNVALGMRAVFWPTVLMLPLLPVFFGIALSMGVVDALTGGSFVINTSLIVLCLLVTVFPVLVYPLALIHMSAPYTYKAWILLEMVKVYVRNIAPALYWLVMAIVVMLPVWSVLGLLGYLLGQYVLPGLQGNVESMVTWVLETIGENPAKDGLFFQALQGTVFGVLGVSAVAFCSLLLSFPAVFLVRANGLLAYFNQERLGLVFMHGDGEPVGFWVRTLANVMDLSLVPLTLILVIKDKATSLIGLLVNVAGAALVFAWPGEDKSLPALVGGAGWAIYSLWMYFAVQEAAYEQSTIGKAAFGFIVTDLEGNPITLQQATRRFFVKLLSVATLGLGYLPLAFNEKKQAWHDSAAKTLVVWKPDAGARHS